MAVKVHISCKELISASPTSEATCRMGIPLTRTSQGVGPEHPSRRRCPALVLPNATCSSSIEIADQFVVEILVRPQPSQPVRHNSQ